MTTDNSREVIIMKCPKMIIGHMCLTAFLEHDQKAGGEAFFFSFVRCMVLTKALESQVYRERERERERERDRYLDDARIIVAGVCC